MDLRPEKPSMTYANCYPTHKEEIEDFEKRKKKNFKKYLLKYSTFETISKFPIFLRNPIGKVSYFNNLKKNGIFVKNP